MSDNSCMSDALRRAIRTAAQLIVSGTLTVLVNNYAKGMTAEQAGLVLAVWQVLVTLAHNWLEDNTKFPAILKAAPSSGENPVTQDPPS